LLLIACALLLRSRSATATSHTCGPDPVANTATVLCVAPGGPCTATSVTMGDNIEVTSGGCTFDIGGRTLSIPKTFQMVGTGFITFLNAGNTTITSTGKLKARGDFNQPSGFFIQGGSITVNSNGTITLDGLIDVSGDSAGTITFNAVGDIHLDNGSTAQGNGVTSTSDNGFGDGGLFQVTTTAGSITAAGTVTMVGNSQASGGEVDLTAARDINVQQTIDASGGGGDGGCLDFEAGDNITVTKTLTVDSNVGAGFGGDITLIAGEDPLGGVVPGGALTVNGATIRFNGSDSQASSGDAGELDASAAGPIKFLGSTSTIRGNGGSLFDGSGGTVCFDSTDFNPNHIGPLDGDITVEGTVILRSAGQFGDGGCYEVSAGRGLIQTGTVDVSGQDTGGDISIDTGSALAINGSLTAQGLSPTGDPGSVDLLAGQAADAGLVVAQNVIASGGPSDGTGQFISLAGCELTVNSGVRVDGSSGMTSPSPGATPILGGSEIDLIAPHPMQLQASSQFLAGPGGSILTIHPPGQNPVIGGGVVFNPARTDQPIAAGPYPACPVCGDGIVQPGEVCDNGAAAQGSCCNADCTAFTCPTVTTTPTAAGPTPSPTMTVPRTSTPTPLRTVTPTSTGATVTPIASATPVASATPSRTPTPVPTPSATPTVAVAGNPDLDHFNCYTARTAPGTAGFTQTQVALDDPFESRVMKVLRTNAFCTAVDKDGQGIPDPAARMQCYNVRNASGEKSFVRQTVSVADDLGTSQWSLRKPQLLCVPGEHDGGTVSPKLDRFKCYSARTATGQPKFAARQVTLTDEFGAKQTMVLKPFQFCDVTDVNGEGTVSGAARLQCYKIKYALGETRFTRRTIAATDQFASEQLSLQRPDFVCAPATRSGPPRCGDGYLDPGEQCDDGNTVNGDGCDSQCQLERCGNGIVEPGEQCDDGAGNGTDDCCSSTCRIIDTDGDGICDRNDICPADADNDSDGDGFCVGPTFNPPAVGGDDPCSRKSGFAWMKPKVLFSGLTGAAGTQKVLLKGSFTIPFGGLAIDPLTFGVHIRVRDAARNLVLDEHVPGGVFSSTQPIGWKANGVPATKWTFLDKAHVPPILNGIDKVVIGTKAAIPGLVTVQINGKSGSYALVPGEEPVTVEIALNDTATPSGAMPGTDQCGETVFVAAPGIPSCAFNGAHDKLLCK
jgi:cysteine-rich repeat protein